MPKRSTATYTSEDAPPDEEATLFVYYCKYSGEHCLITDASLHALPRRRTDGALVLDSERYVLRLQAAQQPPKYIKRCARAAHTRGRLRSRAPVRRPCAARAAAQAAPTARARAR
jgi:hypothetical protein